MNKKPHKVTNEKGFTFEIEEDLTKWAHSNEGNFEKVLPKEYVVLKVSKENRIQSYILFNTKNQKPICERSSGYEDMAVYLTMMKAKINMEE